MSAEVTDSKSRAEEAWSSPSWKAVARAYHSDQKRATQSAPAGLVLSVDYLLAELRCAALRARLIQADIDAVGLAVKAGSISPEQALDLLEDIDLLRFIQPTLATVSP